jgi:hypothetical protein
VLGGVAAFVVSGLLGVVIGWRALHDPEHSPPPYTLGQWLSDQLDSWQLPTEPKARDRCVAKVRRQGLVVLVSGILCLLFSALVILLAWLGF